MRAIAISIVTLSLGAATAVSAAADPPTPAELLEAAPAPGGFELATDELRSQGFDEFAGASPYSVGHVQSASAEADALLAGQDVWGLGDDENLLREVVRWSSADAAERYLQEVVAYAAGDALGEVEAPFAGAQAFSGSDPVAGVWVRIVVWTEGRFGAAVTHFAAGGDPSDAVVNAAADALAGEMAAGATPAVDDATDADPEATDDAGGGGGIPITTVLLFVVIVGGAIWMFLRLRKRMANARRGPAATPRPTSEPATADEPATPSRRTDDIVDEARRKARDEVERTSDRWQIPDDY